MSFSTLQRIHWKCKTQEITMVSAITLLSRVCLIILCLLPFHLLAQTISLEGNVNTAEDESLPFATVLVLPDSTVLSANEAGVFSMQLKPGPKTIRITYTGYQVLKSTFLLRKDTTITFTLSYDLAQLRELTITANPNSQQAFVESSRTGTTTITKKEIMDIPVLGGEADVIKTLQLLPGTIRGIEGSSDLFVRGGAADQNLVLLDGAPIYNTSHLFGFLSVFNADVLEKVEAINGGFPAEYGGRLSSIIDISSNSSIANKTRLSGDLGLIASRLYLEQPLIKDKASIWLAGRRTYVDRVVKAIGQELPYYFYDLNGKISIKTGRHDQLDISYYGGEDVLNYFRDRNKDGEGFTSSFLSENTSQSVQWRHRPQNKWHRQVALTRTAYQYEISNAFGDNELLANSDIVDWGASLFFEKHPVGKQKHIKWGVDWIRHEVSPSLVNTAGYFAELVESTASRGRVAYEMAAHLQQEWLLKPSILINAGLRGSLGWTGAKKYFIPEPRLSMRFAMPKEHALKLSYARMAQYMHRISNSTISTPTDIWYPITADIRPQTAHQLSVAWQKFITGPKIFLSAEAYYKAMHNLIGFQEGANLFFNADFESKLIQGSGRAYGLELLVRKESGKFTGWLSYTLSWSWRQYDALNKGQWFLARYDRRHNGAVVMQYALGRRWTASGVWEFISGSRFTPIIGQYITYAPTLSGVDLVPIFSDMNGVKLADTHRLDLGLKYMSDAQKRFAWQFFIGVNNVYNRASPIGISIEQRESDGALYYSQPGLFGLLPFVSLGFRL